MRFAIFGSSRQAVQQEAIESLLAAIAEHDSELAIDRTYADRLAQAAIPTHGIATFEGDDFAADFAISIGGDGTLLKTATRIHSRRIPIVGINMGRMGYLADIMPSEIAGAIGDLYNERYSVERHSVLAVAIEGTAASSSYALNDVAILKRDTASMISINVMVNDEYMATYRADGLIVATPTGSTAYNLSNGGPIMAASAKTLCLTAVAPHSLNLRPVVIDDASVVKMTVESRSQNFLLAVDGRSTTLRQGAVVVVRKAPYVVEMVKLPGKHYFETLRQKMMWGADARKQ